MCLSPIKIRNNSRSFESFSSPLFNEVPCGHCDECISKLHNDWFVRLAYEWFRIQKIGGIAYFVTLTYNDKNLPFLKFDSTKIDILHNGLKRLSLENDDVLSAINDFSFDTGVNVFEYIPFDNCHFSKDDLSKFIKAFRQVLDYENIYHYDDKDTIKFWIGSEYGHDRHRVHYHVLFFLPFLIDKDRFLDLVKYAWSYSVKRCDCPTFIIKVLDNRDQLSSGITCLSTPNGKDWLDWFIKKTGNHIYVKNLRGNCEYSKRHPASLQSVNGLYYVIKYVSKKDEYLSEPRWSLLQRFLKIFPRNLDDISSRYPDLCKLVKELRSYFPFVHCSHGLGISILDEFNLLSEDDKVKYLVEPSISIAGQTKRFSVPSYIVNRVMYDVDNCDSTLRVLSSIGVKVLKYRLNLRVEEFGKKVDKILHEDLPMLNKSDYLYLSKKFPYIDSSSFIKPSSRDLAIYLYFFKNVQCPDRSQFYDLPAVIDTFYHQYFYKKIYRNYDIERRPCDTPYVAVNWLSKYCWNFQPCFSGFDEWLQYLFTVHKIVGERRSKYYEHENKQNSYYRSFFQSLLYSPY